MRHFSRCLAASVFALIGLAAQAQESGISKADMPDPRASVDQNPVSIGDVPQVSQGMSQRTRITNDSSLDTGNALEGEQARRYGERRMEMEEGLRRKPVESQFQKFIFESTSNRLPVFGADFFAGAKTAFNPSQSTPVPSEQPLGPGDEILIRGWGTIDIDYRAVIDRNGMVAIPTIGSISLGGVKAGDADGVIAAAVGKLYKGVNLSVSFGKLRAITVYVVGQANRPGTYTLSSLSTLVTGLFASGGPNGNGSMRKVQVKRNGKTVAELDMYAFIAKGDKSGDIKLVDGDTIYIPPAAGFVALVGKVNAPAIYELKTGADSIESLLDISGGLPVVADPRRAFLERLDPTRNRPRSIEQFALDGTGLKKELKNGDVLNITSITPEFSNAVVLRGNVDQPMRVPFKPGMRISDLIPSKDLLITRASVNNQNGAYNAGGPDDGKPNGQTGMEMTGPSGYEMPRPNNGKEQGTNGKSSRGLAARIGSLLEEVNWDYAVIERVNRNDLTVSLVPFNLGRVFSNPGGSDNLALEAGDIVTIFSARDVLVPADRRQIFVRVEGEVNVPGVYQMTHGDNLQTLLARAGGPTPNAYLFGTAFYREAARADQEANLKKVTAKLETQMRLEQSRSISNARSVTQADAQLAESRRQAELGAASEAIAQLRQLAPTGRIAFGLDTRERSFGRLPQLRLENGDRLVVPYRPDFIHVMGAVNADASPVWRADYSVGKYLKTVGVSPEADLDNVFIIRVDGTVVSGESGKWFNRGIDSADVMPGDTIVVPQRLNTETAWTRFTLGVREWAQIFANFGLGAAAIKVLK